MLTLLLIAFPIQIIFGGDSGVIWQRCSMLFVGFPLVIMCLLKKKDNLNFLMILKKE
jgi:hypothetical protein